MNGVAQAPLRSEGTDYNLADRSCTAPARKAGVAASTPIHETVFLTTDTEIVAEARWSHVGRTGTLEVRP